MKREGTTMSEDMRPELVSPAPPPKRTRILIYGAVLLVVFLLGFIPMWLKARQCANGLAEAESQLRLSRMQNSLASAVINARRGDYEPARQAASQFFTTLRDEADKGDASIFTQAQREGMKPLFTQRDEIITLLARNDPASADRLSDLYVSYRQLIGS
jgi:hypothetical protein